MPGFLKFSIADLTQAAVFAALIVVLGLPGQIQLSSGVPITLQSMGIMLAGLVLGPKKGALAVVIFMVLAIAGLPVLAGGRTGLTSLAAPTAGYFVGFLPAVIVIGLLTAMLMPRYSIVWGFLAAVIGGILIDYACGIVGLLIRTDESLEYVIITANASFVPGDLLKALVASLVAAAVHRGRPGLVAPLRLRRTSPAAVED
ncbi:MAG: biotin transporter BioY [Gordonia sp. (in: high G+C Gram-positive bacteria)]|uniref:biotin transporter BioY n=1 Tax=Gordonia sp. (in: high G+C Gram-positive bacteria) TaxID=84139 RepID=UPI0039E6A5F2